MKGGCDYSALAKVDAQLQELLNGRLDAIIDEKSSEAAAALLSKLKKRTPVGKAPTFDGPMIESVEIVPVVQTVKRKKKDGTCMAHPQLELRRRASLPHRTGP